MIRKNIADYPLAMIALLLTAFGIAVVYSAGQTWTEPPNSHHIVSANASKTKPARLIAYIIADDGVEVTVYDK